MTIFQTIILAIIEGLTEFLPISSTGHLILAEHFLKIESTDFVKSFDIIIQFSAILAVVFLYRKKIFSNTKLWKPIIVAFLPTGILGLALYKVVKNIFLGNPYITVISLVAGGLALLLIDKIYKNKKASREASSLSIPKLLNIGLFQSLSMIPGVSRSAASITGGLVSGLSRVDAVEFSFLLAIPTMITASGYDLLKSGLSFTSSEIFLLFVGSVFSFLSALIAVKAFVGFVSKHNFTPFAIYRIILGISFWLVFLR